MFLDGPGGDQNARQAARWFKLAARKGHVGAQAEFGHMLFEGIGVDRRPVEGLMWLSIARLIEPRRSADPGAPRAGVLDRQRGAAARGDGDGRDVDRRTIRGGDPGAGRQRPRRCNSCGGATLPRQAISG